MAIVSAKRERDISGEIAVGSGFRVKREAANNCRAAKGRKGKRGVVSPPRGRDKRGGEVRQGGIAANDVAALGLIPFRADEITRAQRALQHSDTEEAAARKETKQKEQKSERRGEREKKDDGFPVLLKFLPAL